MMSAPAKAEFNADHYPKGVNSDFLKDETAAEELLEEFGNGKGKFENPELRDVAAHVQDIVEYLFQPEGHVGLQSGSSILDFGAGTGFILENVAPHIGEHGNIFATEISQAFCALINRKLEANELLKRIVKICLTSETALEGVDDNSCDAALVIDVYHHISFPQQILQEIRRVLKPQGKLLVIDYHRDSSRVRSHPVGWVESHVRQDQDTCRMEIVSEGFELLDEPLLGMEESYAMVFKAT